MQCWCVNMQLFKTTHPCINTVWWTSWLLQHVFFVFCAPLAVLLCNSLNSCFFDDLRLFIAVMKQFTLHVMHADAHNAHKPSAGNIQCLHRGLNFLHGMSPAKHVKSAHAHACLQ